MNDSFDRDSVSPEDFVGRTREIRLILDRLGNPNNRGSSAIFGEVGVGKTALLAHLSHSALFKEWELERELIIVSLDCTTINPWSSELFWQSIWRRFPVNQPAISDQDTIIDAVKSTPVDSLEIKALINNVADRGYFLVFLLDNFDWVIEHIPPTDLTFLNIMRSFLVDEKKGLGIVLTTRENLNDYMSAKLKFTVSPFDNVFVHFELKPLAD